MMNKPRGNVTRYRYYFSLNGSNINIIIYIYPQIENIRRKHNYLPLIVELLKILASNGQLMPLYEKAKQRAIERESTKTK